MNQHYVPRTYLKNFATKKNGEFFVDAYDLKTQRFIKANIKKICGEKDLYTVNDPRVPNPLVIESTYADQYEPLYERVYKILTDDSIISISDETRRDIIVAVCQFYFRNPKSLNDIIKFHLKRIEKDYLETKERGEGNLVYLDEIYDISQQSCEEIQEKFSKDTKFAFKVGHFGRFIDLVNARAFDSIIVYKIIDDSSFITCDNPLPSYSILNTSSADPFTEDRQFYLPLDGQHCIGLQRNKNIEHNVIERIEVDFLMSVMICYSMYTSAQRFIIGSRETIEKEIVGNHMFTSQQITCDHLAMLRPNFEYLVEMYPKIDFLREYFAICDSKGGLSEEEGQEILKKYALIAEEEVKARL